jgi:hypothetical protein
MSSKSIYTPDPTDPFIVELQQTPMPKLPADATLANMSGEMNPFWGMTHTEEKKKYWSETRKGKRQSQEHSDNIRKTLSDGRRAGKGNNFYGKTHSEETKTLFSETRKGKGNSMYGRSAITEQQLRWYTDGTKNIYVTENTQPYGFRRGRSGIKRRTQAAILEARKSLSNS